MGGLSGQSSAAPAAPFGLRAAAAAAASEAEERGETRETEPSGLADDWWRSGLEATADDAAINLERRAAAKDRCVGVAHCTKSGEISRRLTPAVDVPVASLGRLGRRRRPQTRTQ
uniref:Uncharacterized protein n=1 Tax=Plectus sambesii TaxID=2011161 RepID=A0A914VEF7_9BILA